MAPSKFCLLGKYQFEEGGVSNNVFFKNVVFSSIYFACSFFRKGKAGGYQDEMSPEYIQKFDEWKRKQPTTK